MEGPIGRRQALTLGLTALCGCCCTPAASQQFPKNASKLKKKTVVCGLDPDNTSIDFKIDRRRLLTSSSTELDRYIGVELNALNTFYRTGKNSPNFYFYDDSDKAIAAKAVRETDDRTTILLGLALLNAEMVRVPALWSHSIIGTLAHEWAHDLQYNSSLDDQTFNRETHADFMSGWYMGVKRVFGLAVDPRIFASSIYLHGALSGQTKMFNPRLYGSPEQRVRAMMRGFDYGISKTSRSSQPDVYTAANDGYHMLEDFK